MVETTAGQFDSPDSEKRARRLRSLRNGDAVFYWACRIAAISVLLLLGGIIVSLVVGAWPAIKTFGFGFLTTQRWAPTLQPQPVLGGLAPIYGTLLSSLIAMAIAVPVGLGIAIFLTELCPPSLKRPTGMAIELLAGIPSIIYGMWGFFVLGPFMYDTFQPFCIRMFRGVPWLRDVFSGPPSNLSLFSASIILAIMVLPFVTAIAKDVFETVPNVLKEAAYGIGCTRWEVEIGRASCRERVCVPV